MLADALHPPRAAPDEQLTDSEASTSIMTKTDFQLKQDVDDELRRDPRVNAAQIG
jgi:hypothetical protein